MSHQWSTKPPVPVTFIAVSALGVLLMSCMDSLPLYRGPYLSWKQDPQTTMTVTFEHLKKTTAHIKWGDRRDALTHTKSFRQSKRRDDMYVHFTTTLTGLSPDTTYFYTIPGVRDEPTPFRTAPESQETPFSFLVYGDSCETGKEDENEHYDIVAQMNAVKTPFPTGFVISSGDLTPYFADVYGWDLHFDAIRDLADHLPYFSPFGNHDWNMRKPHNTGLTAVWIHEFPEKTNSNQNVSGFGKTSFAFAYGAAYFIFIGYDQIGSEKGSPFNAWLESQLLHAHTDYAFTFVDFHKPPFDRRDSGYMDNEAMLRHQAKLFHDYHVTIVFSGHNHVFSHHEIERKSDRDGTVVGVTYLISGGGGQELRKALEGTWDNRHGEGFYGKTIHATRANHFLRVDVNSPEHSVAVTAFDRNGNRLYGPFTKTAGR